MPKGGPRRNGRPIDIELPAIENPQDVAAAMGAITAGVSNGTLTAEEAGQLAHFLESYARIATMQDVATWAMLAFPSYVPKTDSDGNDIAGIRLPELTVPLATYTGWGLRSGVWANDGCEASGQYIPFAKAEADRMASGDPRPSVEERYKSYAQYRGKVIQAVDKLVRSRFLICDDTQDIVTRLIAAGQAAGVPASEANENTSVPDPVPACQGRMPPHGHHYHYVFEHDHDHDGDRD